MLYAGVLFDLFGTLVTPYRTREHRDILRECALHLGVEFEDCYRIFGETYPSRMRGAFPTIRDNLAFMAQTLGSQPTTDDLARAEACYDAHRPDVISWQGPRVTDLVELHHFLSRA